jgi:hypothetical protein
MINGRCRSQARAAADETHVAPGAMFDRAAASRKQAGQRQSAARPAAAGAGRGRR